MVLKPTFPSPYMTNVDATENIVISCMVSSRNYIEGYDLCLVRYDESENKEQEIHIIGVVQPGSTSKMYKLCYISGSYLGDGDSLFFIGNSINTNDDTGHRHYIPNQDLNETKLPIDNVDDTELRIVIPASLTVKYGDSLEITGVDETQDVQLLSNGYTYSWNIRLFEKDSVLGFGTLKISAANTSKGEISKAVFPCFSESEINAFLNCPNGWGIISAGVSTNFKFTVNSSALVVSINEYNAGKVGYCSSSDDKYTSTSWYSIFFKSTRTEYMAKSLTYWFTTSEPPTIQIPEAYDGAGQYLNGYLITGEYTVPQKEIKLDSWNVTLYNAKNDIVEDSGDKYSQKILYNLKPRPWVEDCDTVILTCKFNNGATVTTSKSLISNSLFCPAGTQGWTTTAVSDTDYLTVEIIKDVAVIKLSQVESWVPAYATEDNFGWGLFKRYKNTEEILYIGFFDRGQTVYDYNASSGMECDYLIIQGQYNSTSKRVDFYRMSMAPSGDRRTLQFITEESVSTKSSDWVIYDLISLDDNGSFSVDKANIWRFNTGIENGTFTPTYNKSVEKTFGKFPKIYFGDNNYLTGTLKTNIGNISCGNTNSSEYENDDIYMLNKWKDFCANENMKLLKSPKGHLIPCYINETSYEVANSPQQETELSFEYVQVEDATNINVYEVE